MKNDWFGILIIILPILALFADYQNFCRKEREREEEEKKKKEEEERRKRTYWWY